MYRPTTAVVDLEALRANYRALEAFLRAETPAGETVPGIIAVVKANAYGHGALAVARALEQAGASRFACADIEEGILLRDGGVRSPILIFGALGVSMLDGVFTHGLTPTISTPSAARALQRAAAARGVRLGCHLKIDTGMHRLGFRHDNLARTMPEVLSSPNLAIEAVYTHFATADDPDDPLYESQRSAFEHALGQLGSLGMTAARRHAANSAALLRDRRVWYDFVRPGLLLYGVVPPPLASTLPIRAVMTLRSRIVAVKGLRPEESVGYGARYRAESARRIAVVPAGYADGLDLRLAGRAHVIVGGQRAPIVGAVSMDMITVDVTDIPAEPGMDVVLIGGEGPDRVDVREMAAAIGTIPYEILCRLGSRVARVYENG